MTDANDTTTPHVVNPLAQTTTPSTNEDYEREIAERSGDLALPLYPTGDEAKDRYLFDVPEDLRDQFDTVSKAAAPSLDPAWGLDDDDFTVFKHALSLLLPEIPAEHDAHIADLLWAWVRIVCAGAGYARHAELSSWLCNEFPLCPMDADEDHNTWMRQLNGAHGSCGWPVSLVHLDFYDVCRVYPVIEGFTPSVPKWMRVLAMFHYVKHSRCCLMSAPAGIKVQYHRGTPATFACAVAEPLAPRRRPDVANSLGAPRTPGRLEHAPASALAWAMGAVAVEALMHTEPAVELPPQFIVSPAADVVPCVTNRRGFVRTGRGMTGVWRASGGVLKATRASHRLSLGTWWPEPTSTVEQFARVLPTSYKTKTLPAQLLRDAFPNLLRDPADPAAWDCIVSAVIMSGLMDGFGHERPVMVACPNDQTDVVFSTNTGKSTLIVALARIWSPGITSASVPGVGAPAQRSLMAELQQHGTVALDEFSFGKHEGALFSEQSILAMCTGNEATIGKVYSNVKESAKLRAPLPLSTKVWQCKDDLFTRSIPLPLRPLTEAERASTKYNEVAKGTWSIACRLTCLHMIETYQLQALIDKANPPGGVFRFNTLRYLSAILLMVAENLPSLADAFLRIDDAARRMVEWQDDKLREAVSSGAMAAARAQGKVIFDFDAMIHELNPTELGTFASILTEPMNPKDMFRAFADARGDSRDPTRVFEDLTGYEGVRPRQMSVAIANCLKRLLPAVGDEYTLPGVAGLVGGYTLVRDTDRSNYVRVRVEQKKQTEAFNPLEQTHDYTDGEDRTAAG